MTDGEKGISNAWAHEADPEKGVSNAWAHEADTHKVMSDHEEKRDKEARRS